MAPPTPEQTRPPHGRRIALGLVALAVVTSIAAVFGLGHAADRLREQTDAVSREIADRIRPRPPIPTSSGNVAESSTGEDAESSAFEAYDLASRRLDAATVPPLADAFQNDSRPDPEVLAAALVANRAAVEAAVAAARHPLGAGVLPADPLSSVDVFEHINLGHMLRAAALDAASAERRVELWATAFQHARDVGDHTSLLMALVGASILEPHCTWLTESLAEHPMPPEQARRLSGFLLDLAAAWPEPGGVFLREAEWIGRIHRNPASLDVSRLHIWRHGFSWTLCLSAGMEHQLAVARIIDPLLSRPFDVVHTRLRDYESTHSQNFPLGIKDHHNQLADLLEPLARVRLMIGLLRLHAGDPLGELASPFGGTIRYDSGPGPTQLICPGPASDPEICLVLPETLQLPGGPPEHR